MFRVRLVLLPLQQRFLLPVLQVFLQEELFEKLRDIVGADVAVGEAGAGAGQEIDEHLALAEPGAADLDDLRVDPVGREEGPDMGRDPCGPVGQPAGPGADEEHRPRSPPAGEAEPTGPHRPAPLVVMAQGASRQAVDKVAAGVGGRMPALAAARCG